MGSKHEFVTGEEIWRNIQAALKGRQPARVAVPFIGLGASRWIKPAPGSWVLTRCDLKSARAGQVSGKDLLAWHRRGVRVFNLQALHAKVFAFHAAAFVGSSNASETSRYRLVEAGIWTTEKALVRSAWDFVEELCAEEVEENFLAELEAAYRPPTLFPMHGETGSNEAASRKAQSSSRAQDEAPMHLIRIYPATFDDAQQSAADQAEAAGRQRIDRKLKAELSSFSWKGAPGRFKVGDLVLARWTDRKGGDERVLPWARVVGIRKVRGKDQHLVATATASGMRSLSARLAFLRLRTASCAWLYRR